MTQGGAESSGQDGDPDWYCPDFIYPILDWGGNPGLAVGMVGIGVVLLPLIHLFWMGATKVRILIHRCTLGRKVAASPTPVEMKGDGNKA